MSDKINLGQLVKPSDEVGRYRRIVTANDDAGRSIIRSDDICTNIQTIMGIPEFCTTELWRTDASPVKLTSEVDDPAHGPAVLAPSKQGSIFRIVEFPPDATVSRHRPELQSSDTMHTTPSIDYAFVVSGEIYAVLDGGETKLRAGDTLIQRGTNHGWSNRGDVACRILFVLLGADLTA